jgi:hypothetical protein
MPSPGAMARPMPPLKAHQRARTGGTYPHGRARGSAAPGLQGCRRAASTTKTAARGEAERRGRRGVPCGFESCPARQQKQLTWIRGQAWKSGRVKPRGKQQVARGRHVSSIPTSPVRRSWSDPSSHGPHILRTTMQQLLFALARVPQTSDPILSVFLPEPCNGHADRRLPSMRKRRPSTEDATVAARKCYAQEKKRRAVGARPALSPGLG